MSSSVVKTDQGVSSVPTPSALSTLLAAQSSSGHASPISALPLEILHNLRHQHGWTELRLHYPDNALEPATRSLNLDRVTPLSCDISDLDLATYQEVTPQISRPNQHAIAASRSFSKPLSTSTPNPSTSALPTTLLSGQPPKPLYIHPDLQLKLLRAGISATSPLYPSEREWVLPTSLARKWTLRELCAVFDMLPPRDPISIGSGQRTAGRSPLSRRDGDVYGIDGSVDESETETEEEREGAKYAESLKLNQRRGTKTKSQRAPRGQKQQQRQQHQHQHQHQDAKRVLLAMKSHDGRGGDGTIVYYIVQEGEVKPRQN